MKFISRYGHTLGLSLILLVFVLAKLPDLPTPYFWDELGVYARGALNMKDTGHFSLLPSAMDPELSRGHPLLSYLGYALAFKLFGDTPVVGHSFTLLLAATALLATYLFARRAIGRPAALIAIALLAVQPLFYAMAGIIMPEMMLTLFSIGAMWGLLSRRWGLYLISAICCVIIKEAGIVVPAAAMLFTGIEGFLRSRKLFTASVLKELMLCFAPLLAFAGFLLIQKYQYGWYFFPFHTSLIRRDPAAIGRSAKRILNFIFMAQGRWFLFLFICAGTVLELFRTGGAAQRRMVLACWIFVIVALGFAAPNYHMVRYILYVLPFTMVLAGIGMVRTAQLLPVMPARAVALGCCLGGLIMGVANLYIKGFADNSNMSYKYLVASEQMCIRWAEQQSWKDSVITANFPVNAALFDRRSGYLITRQSWPAQDLKDGRQTTRYGIYYWRPGIFPLSPRQEYQELKRFRINDAIFSVVLKCI